MLKGFKFKAYHILFLVPIAIVFFITNVSANYQTAKSYTELISLMASEIKKDVYTFSIAYSGSDLDFLNDADKLFEDASSKAGDYYLHNLRPSGIRVSQVGSLIVLNFMMEFETSSSEIAEIKAFVKKEADKILLTTKDPATVIKKTNDFLVSYVTYGSLNPSDPLDKSFSAYGIIKDKYGRNMAYTYILDLFFDYYGYESYIIRGMVGATYNSWNLVKIGTSYYHLDTGDNDKTGSNNYLLKSDSTISSSRTWDYGKYPKAASDYNFSTTVVVPPVTEPGKTYPIASGFHEYVYDAYDLGLLNDKIIKTDLKKEITREEFVEIILAVFEKYSDKNTPMQKTFTDTTNPDIIKAYELGIINGVSETKFAPASYLTREQACVILLRFITLLDGPTYYENVTITDKNEVSSWALEAMNYMVYNKIVAGVGGGRVAPKGTLIKEHAIILAVRVYNLMK